VRLPDDSRTRIVQALRQNDAEITKKSELIEFQWRPLAYAAALVALVGVIGVVLNFNPTSITVVEAPAESFELMQKFAALQVAEGIKDLDYEKESSDALVVWLKNRDASTAEKLDSRLAYIPAMGCKIYDFPGHQLSVICFDFEEHGMVHFFVTDMSGFNPAGVDECCETKAISNRNTVSWHDDDNA